MIGRRRLMLTAAAAPLACPAVGAGSQTLRMMPQAVLNTIDPVWSSTQIVRNMSFMMFETLYGRDENMNPHPQMLEGGLMEDGGKRWTLKLREHQTFHDGTPATMARRPRWHAGHDGTPVLARDCVASLRRWMKRDPSGAALEAWTDELSARDDRTIQLRLSQPFSHLPELLSKFVVPAVIMPERIAMTDPFKQIPEAIGSGPFRWLADEHILGSRTAFAKYEKYVPRNEKPSWTAGGRQVLVDRVEWHMIPDGGTAVNALRTGEIDWIEIPLPDLMPMPRKSPGIQTGHLDAYGQIMALRVNHLAQQTKADLSTAHRRRRYLRYHRAPPASRPPAWGQNPDTGHEGALRALHGIPMPGSGSNGDRAGGTPGPRRRPDAIDAGGASSGEGRSRAVPPPPPGRTARRQPDGQRRLAPAPSGSLITSLPSVVPTLCSPHRGDIPIGDKGDISNER